MARKRFSFRSSGKLATAREFAEYNTPRLPVGIKTPLELNARSANEDFYKMHFDPVDQVKDNFRNILLTNFGERLGRADIGANLKSLLFDMSSSDSVEGEVSKRIEESARISLPMVSIQNIDVGFLGMSSDRSVDASTFQRPPGSSRGLSGMTVKVLFSIPKMGATNQLIEVFISSAG